MAFINRCQNCSIGTSFCVYTKTITVINNFKKEVQIVPGDNCIMNREDEYAIWVDTEEDEIAEDVVMLKYRECEYDYGFDLDIFHSNLYLWESVSTNITTGDMFYIDSQTINNAKLPCGITESHPKRSKVIRQLSHTRRFEYEHPLYHIIDYNVPLNRSGKVRLTENCHVMGKENLYLISTGWHEDDGGEAKKAIGIPKIRRCMGLYGTYDKNAGMVMHKSMKDWITKIPTFKNFTKVKVSSFVRAKYNIFQNSHKEIDDYICSVIDDIIIQERIFEAFEMIKGNVYINVRQLLLNNGVSSGTTRAITDTISTKDPKKIYQNDEGYRYNIHKIEALYFNIVNNVINITVGKTEILANIVNFILNDNVLMAHQIGVTNKFSAYLTWYEENVSTMDQELADELHPSRHVFNEYNSDNFLDAAFRVIKHAIGELEILTLENLPKEFKEMRKNYLKYMKAYVEPVDIFDIGAATLNLKEFLNPSDEQIYNLFKRFVVHFDRIKPIEVQEIWHKFEHYYKLGDASSFWDYIEDEATTKDIDEEFSEIEDKFNYQKLLELYTGDDIFELTDIEPHHGPYIRIRQKRYYDKRNQENELRKMLDPMEEKFTDDNACEVIEFDDNYDEGGE